MELATTCISVVIICNATVYCLILSLSNIDREVLEFTKYKDVIFLKLPESVIPYVTIPISAF